MWEWYFCQRWFRDATLPFGNDMIIFMIHSSQYDNFHDTFAALGCQTYTCNPGLWPEAMHSASYYCLHSNLAQWLQQWQSPQSFLQYFCVEFFCFIWIYWLLFAGISYLFITIARARTVSHRIIIFLSVLQYILSAQIYWCSGTMMKRYTLKVYEWLKEYTLDMVITLRIILISQLWYDNGVMAPC